ncbi:hypothetical protein Taro_036285 [Colocasia esculenta]|uniref:Uncharacterized protein n=1 Tax=Colocasia esculenta TaxID=4460 RepID=A0A843W2N7_COLES|nr:hypothetical protein [Colocasia esculenta]
MILKGLKCRSQMKKSMSYFFSSLPPCISQTPEPPSTTSETLGVVPWEREGLFKGGATDSLMGTELVVPLKFPRDSVQFLSSLVLARNQDVQGLRNLHNSYTQLQWLAISGKLCKKPWLD